MVNPNWFETGWATSPVPDVLVLALSAGMIIALSDGKWSSAFTSDGGRAEPPGDQSQSLLRVDPTVEILRKRANGARFAAGLSIAAIICLIAFAAGILLTTIEDTSIDAPLSQRSKLEQEREELTLSLLQLRSQIVDKLPEDISVDETFGADEFDVNGLTDFARANLPAVPSEGESVAPRQEFISFVEDFARGNARLRRVNSAISELPEQDDFLSERNQFFYVTLQSVLVRLTAVVLVLFLVRLLFSLYRYLTRLAAAHNSQADAIELINYDAENLSKLISALSPEKYDFGKTPRAPVDQAVDIVRAFAGSKPK
ncbi:MAG: hypothetical protein AAF636_22980 [Pseudomonadota bacterium]